MKKIVMAIILGLTVPQAHADSEFCSRLADLMQVVTQGRDAGIALTEVKKGIADAGLPPHIKKMVFGMADGVYYGENFQAMTPRQVAVLTYKICMEAWKK